MGKSGPVPATDVKRPEERVPWVMKRIDREEVAPNYYSMVSLVFGMIAITMRVKVHAWLCCLFCMAHLVTSRYSELDMRQTMGSIMLAVMTFVSVYVQPVLTGQMAQGRAAPEPVVAPPAAEL